MLRNTTKPINIMDAALNSAGRAYGKLASQESALNRLGKVAIGSASQLPMTKSLSVSMAIETLLLDALTWSYYTRDHKTRR